MTALRLVSPGQAFFSRLLGPPPITTYFGSEGLEGSSFVFDAIMAKSVQNKANQQQQKM